MSNKPVTFRPYAPADAPALAAVCRAAITVLGRSAYTTAELDVWASYPDDLEEFRDRLARGFARVAETEGRVAAFIQLDRPDHLDFLYCAPPFARRGLASALYVQAEAHARAQGAAEIHTKASRVSRPFFEKMGFIVLEAEQVERSGVTLERFRMRKALA